MKKFFGKRCFFTLFRIPYIGGKRKKIFSKKGLGLSQKLNQFYAGVATLALLAVLPKRQAGQN